MEIPRQSLAEVSRLEPMEETAPMLPSHVKLDKLLIQSYTEGVVNPLYKAMGEEREYLPLLCL